MCVCVSIYIIIVYKIRSGNVQKALHLDKTGQHVPEDYSHPIAASEAYGQLTIP